MAIKQAKKAKLGRNPLADSIFSKTENLREECESEKEFQESRKKNQDSLVKKEESRFFIDTEKEKINLRIPIVINDWLDDLIKNGKRKHGQKIPKEVWVQAALEFFKVLPIQWDEMSSKEKLGNQLIALEQKIKNIES